MLNLCKPIHLACCIIFYVFISLPLELKAQNYPVSDFDPNLHQVIAFPGAEGYGKFVTGGRGGQVIKVTNLNDDGPGSLRAAIEAKGARIIVFEVSGNIPLKSILRIRDGNLTIAGQTAPGEGITLQNYPLLVMDVENVIIRYIRSRMGDLAGVAGDAFDARNVKNMIVDHCSFSWGTDETCTVYDVENVTIQNSIISEGLNRPANINNGDHAYGSLLGGKNLSFYNNLMAHFVLRSPSLTTGSGLTDLRNNVIYNWDTRSTNNGALAKANFFFNYYKPGPSTNSKPSNQHINQHFLWPTSHNNDPKNYGKFHLEGNKLVGRSQIDTDQWAGVRLENSDLTDKYLETLKNKDQNGRLVAFPVPDGIYSRTRTADAAYQFVLEFSGASLFRDAVDTRIILETRNGTTTFKGSRTGLIGIIDSQKDAGGWPALKSLPALTDSDGDGIPDVWEIAQNLDPKTPNDREYNLSPYYTDIEVYINSLVQDHLVKQNPGTPGQVDLILPANNETVSPLELSFAWKPLLNATEYRMQISKTNDFSSNVITINNVKNYSLVHPGLEENSTYYWRVRASNSFGNGTYSSIRTFKTGSASSSPGRTLLLSPENQKDGISLTPILKWAQVPNSDSYQIQISTSSDFSSFVVNQSNLVSNDFQTPKLNTNRTYYWRVRARNSNGTGSYSNTFSFRTVNFSNSPEGVVPVSPINRFEVLPLNISLEWIEEPTAENYQVQIASDFDFNKVIYNNSNLTGTKLKIPNLESNTTYFWRIRGVNRSGFGSYSGRNEFRTSPFPDAPKQVQIIGPANGSNIFSNRINFEWKDDPTAQSYRFQLSTSSNFSSFVSNVGGLTTNTYTVSNLQSNTQYYWRVIATNESGNSPFSEVMLVRTASYSGTPAATSLLSPSHQTVVGASQITFQWNNQPNTEYYRLEISEQANFGSLTYSKGSISGTSFTVGSLNPGKTYFWRVRTSNPSGSGQWSEVWSLATVDKNIELSQPVLLSPQNSTNFQSNNVSFSWGAVNNATGYHLQISESADFSSISYQNQNINGTSFNLTSLSIGKAYFWRVRARNNTIFSAWSSNRNFSIGSTEVLLTSGLVGHWPMEEGSGNRFLDNSGKNNHATIQNTSNVSWVSGKSGKAIKLNGWSGAFGTVRHHSSLSLPDAITLAAWVKPNELQKGHIFYKSAGNGFELWLDSDGRIEFRLNRGSNGTSYRLRTQFRYNNSVGKWIHIAATFNGSTSKIFINGQEDVAENYPPFKIGTSSGDLILGAMGSIQRWNGELDELHIYERVLANNEILMLMGQEPSNKAVTQSGNLIGYWKMDEGGGNMMEDHSGNGHHAKIQNANGVEWKKGMIDQAISLNGTSGRYGIVSHKSSLGLPNKLTLTAWVKPSEVNRGHIFYKNDGNGFELWLDNDGKVEFRLNRGNSGTSYRLKSNFNYSNWVGKWIHVAATFDGSKSKIFINGIEDNSEEYNAIGIETKSGDLVIGAMGTIQRWSGELDELRIYDIDLSSKEILALMEAVETFAPPADSDNLLGHWKMEEGSGNILIDQSGNKNNATLQTSGGVGWVKGIQGLALDLNGEGGSFAVVPHNSTLVFSEAITISSWVSPNIVGRNTLISKSDGKGFELWLDHTGRVEFRLNRVNDGTTYRLRSSFNYSSSIGKWIHIAATFDGKTCKIYINGREDASTEFSPVNFATSSGNLTIGSMGNIQRFEGRIDELLLFGRALNSNEINNLANETNVMRTSQAESKSNGLDQPENTEMAKDQKINEIEEEKLPAKLYPNPVEGKIHVAPVWIQEGTLAVQIYDLRGISLFEGEVKVYKGLVELEIDRLRLKSGNYILIVQDNFNREIFRFIKK